MPRIPCRRRHSRTLVAVLLTILAVVGQPASISAQASSQAATPLATPASGDVEGRIPTGIDVDLAAMTLLATDMDPDFRPGLAMLSDARTMASLITARAGTSPDTLARQLDDAGFVGAYLYHGGLRDDSEAGTVPPRYGRSYVMLFEDRGGASRGFDLIRDESADSESEASTDAPAIGDRSLVTRRTTIDPASGADESSLDAVFLTDRLIGGVSLVASDGSDPRVDAVAALAKQQLEQTEAVLAGETPGLFLPALRVVGSDEMDLVIVDEDYGLIRGSVPRSSGEPIARYNARVDVWDSAGMTSIYRTKTTLFPSDRSGDDRVPTVGSALYRFGTAEDATAFMREGPSRFLDDLPGDSVAREVGANGLPSVTTRSRSVVYKLPHDEGAATSGQITWARDGAIVVLIRAEGPRGVDAEGIADLVEAQLACLETPKRQCEPVPARLLD